MSKPEWGVKRLCHSCNALYYDMGKDPAICPKCNTPYDPEALLKSRRKVIPDEEIAPAKEDTKKPLEEDQDVIEEIDVDDVDSDDEDISEDDLGGDDDIDVKVEKEEKDS